MGFIFGLALVFIVGVLVLSAVVHLIFALPLWLLIGGAVLFIWARKNAGGRRLLGRGAYGRRYLGTRSRW